MNVEKTGTRTKRTKSILSFGAVSVVLVVGLVGCSSLPEPGHRLSARGQIDPKLGVAPSPRVVADNQPVPKGGGRSLVGQPYVIAGKTYRPREIDPGYKAVGLASWYGSDFHGRRTANGEVFDKDSITAAHPTMPLPSYVRLTSLKTGRSLIVRVNDRGPYHSNRMLDMSQRAAFMLGVKRDGVSQVKMEYVGPAPLDGDDTNYLLASYRGPSDALPGRPNVMLATAERLPGIKQVLGVFGVTPPPPAPPMPSRSMPAPSAAAPVVMANAEPAGIPAPPISVVPPVRPVESVAYVTVASVDPAIYAVGEAPVRLASATTTLTPTTPRLSFTPTVLPQTSDTFTPMMLPPLPPQASGYAAQRVDAAYAALDGVAGGVGMRELALRANGDKADVASKGIAIQLGSFHNPENAVRLGEALAKMGEVVNETVDDGGHPLHHLRLTALKVPADEALAAARAAGATGARIIR